MSAIGHTEYGIAHHAQVVEHLNVCVDSQIEAWTTAAVSAPMEIEGPVHGDRRMRSDKTRAFLAASLACGLALGAALMADSRSTHVDPLDTPRDSVGSLPYAGRLADSASLQTKTAVSESLLEERDEPEGRDALEGWGELTSQTRVQRLEQRFAAAVAAIEAGRQPRAEHVFSAQAALTSMRAELYGTPRGRAQHRRHEARLDRALGEVSPEDEGTPK